MSTYVIQNVENNLFWNNEEGWTGFEDATEFEESEMSEFDLPIDGRWEKSSDFHKFEVGVREIHYTFHRVYAKNADDAVKFLNESGCDTDDYPVTDMAYSDTDEVEQWTVNEVA